MPSLQLLDVEGLRLAQAAVTRHHYLHKPVDVASMNNERSRAFRAQRAQLALEGVA